jgi:RHH-type proline utilization regulon transcriptional repressor/proline dehydrogenase/delta 1-pyrroline-5-carboxylate dehydrogenase
VLAELGDWARRRHERAGGTIRIRLVKGANLAMEAVEAELEGWPQAPYSTKAQVDANFKRLLDTALEPRWAPAVRVGVASHNLFDIAWALSLGAAQGQADRIELEMLEGMAPAQAEAVREDAGRLLLYAPVVAHDDFEAAIAYLVRRFDENAAPDNFLRHLFDLEVGTPTWDDQLDRFERSVTDRHRVHQRPRRAQDRATEQRRFPPGEPFANEPDTDWSRSVNRDWVAGHLARQERTPPPSIRPLVGGNDAEPATIQADEAPREGPLVLEADAVLVDRTVAGVAAAAAAWSSRPEPERRRILLDVAEALAERRGDAIATMVHEAAKTVRQTDSEVSEAVDFASFYAHAGTAIDQLRSDGLRFDPYRVTVVASPWNFPFAIPTGGVMAALAAGSGVILKPAPQTPATARLIVEACLDAGVPPELVGFLPVPEDEVGRRLITHTDVDAVILTGAYDTARMFTAWDPQRRIHAETSGKNALVITATADLDAAVADLVQSAFGHGGQKCSAASLALVEASVHDGPDFLRRLADATRSLTIGDAADPATSVGPLIGAPAGPLDRALRHLDAGESWLVPPEPVDDEERLWRPAIRLGVRPGSWFHRTECFGPVLGVVRVADLDEAIAVQNAVDYGLTGGIHSLDPAEVARWTEQVEVGNAYVNRGTTGAIVQRQPFGGWKRSSVGPTAKAGGPNYLLTLGRWSPTEPVSIDRARPSFAQARAEVFGRDHDRSGLRFESNVLRYRPAPAARR